MGREKSKFRQFFKFSRISFFNSIWVTRTFHSQIFNTIWSNVSSIKLRKEFPFRIKNKLPTNVWSDTCEKHLASVKFSQMTSNFLSLLCMISKWLQYSKVILLNFHVIWRYSQKIIFIQMGFFELEENFISNFLVQFR